MYIYIFACRSAEPIWGAGEEMKCPKMEEALSLHKREARCYRNRERENGKSEM